MSNVMDNALIKSYKELIDKLKKQNFVESLTLIGDSVEKRKKDKVIDLDLIIIITNPMTRDKYNKIKEIYEEVCNKYTNPTVDVMYAIACGPMKPKSFKEYEVFHHCLLFTEEEYKKAPIDLIKLSWQYCKPIIGKATKDMHYLNCVTKDMLLNTKSGINGLIEQVSNDETHYIGWEHNTGNLMKSGIYPLKFKHNDEKTELYIYSVLRCASNLLRMHTKDNSIGTNKEMAKKFKQMFPNLKYNNLPLKLLQDKKLLRNREYNGDVIKLKQQTLGFLNELKNKLGG